MLRQRPSNELKIIAKKIDARSSARGKTERFSVMLEDAEGGLHPLSAARVGKTCPVEISVDRASCSLVMKFTPDRQERVIHLVEMARKYSFQVKVQALKICHSTEVTVTWGFGQTRHIVAFLKMPEIAAFLPAEQLIAALAPPLEKIWWGGPARHRRRFIPARAVRLVA